MEACLRWACYYWRLPNNTPGFPETKEVKNEQIKSEISAGLSFLKVLVWSKRSLYLKDKPPTLPATWMFSKDWVKDFLRSKVNFCYISVSVWQCTQPRRSRRPIVLRNNNLTTLPKYQLGSRRTGQNKRTRTVSEKSCWKNCMVVVVV